MFISTDYVFDGRSPPYKIDSEPNPLNKYGKSKLDGEKVVLEASKGARDRSKFIHTDARLCCSCVTMV